MPFFAIDLGTTNTILARAEMEPNGKITACACPIIDNAPIGLGITQERKHLLPSAVFYDIQPNKRPEIIVGSYAVKNYNQYTSLVSRSVKSQIGNARVEGLADNVPDKTPEDVQKRILRQVIKSAKDTIYCDIKNSPIVITVPAKFDAIKREATKRAAQKAGFINKIYLLSEVSAVLYHVANQILNGDIPSHVLDLKSSKKRVLVFDMGGGTLDVECLEITPTDGGKSLEISHIAPSRLDFAGDEFDTTIANALYERCLKKFGGNSAEYQKLKSSEARVKSLLRTEAEKLKIDMSNYLGRDTDLDEEDWFGEEEEHHYSLSTVLINNLKYYDDISLTEFQEMIRIHFADHLIYEDYRTYQPNPKDRNIIAPIMEALQQADAYYKKRGEKESFCPDAVILAGGMTKFPLIKERLEDFFDGIASVLTIADPDLSVACGAATYAAIMQSSLMEQQTEEMQFEEDEPETREPEVNAAQAGEAVKPSIVITHQKQSHDMFLNLATGAKAKLITTEDDLPHTEKITGLRLKPGTRTISIPLQRREVDGSLPIIARTSIQFSRASEKDDRLYLQVSFDKESLINIKAELRDADGTVKSAGTVDLTIGNPDGSSDAGSAIIPYEGARLNPNNEIYTLQQMFIKQPKHKGGKKKSKGNHENTKALTVDQRLEIICSCGNKSDFHPVLLKYLSDSQSSCELKHYLYRICDSMLNDWSQEEKNRFKEVARRDVLSEHSLHITPDKQRLSKQVQAILDRFMF